MDSKINIYKEISPLYIPGNARLLQFSSQGRFAQENSGTEDAGLYAFQTEQAAVSSKFIHWRFQGSNLHLIEDSLQGILSENSVKINFSNNLLPGGVTFHETAHGVTILVATTAAVHRLVLQKSTNEEESILRSLSPSQLNNSSNVHVYRTQTNVQPPKQASSYLTSNDDAYFAVALETSVLLIKLGKNGQVHVANELKHASFMGRILGGFVPGVLRSSKSVTSAMESVEIAAVDNEIFVFGLTRDAKLHAWNASSCEHKGFKVVGAEYHLREGENKLQVWLDPNDQVKLTISLASEVAHLFVLYELYYLGGVLNFEENTRFSFGKKNLRAFTCGTSELFALSEEHGEFTLSHTALLSANRKWVDDQIWKTSAATELPPHDQLEAKEVYLRDLFKPNQFNQEVIRMVVEEFSQLYELESHDGSLRQRIVSVADQRVSQLLESDIEEDPSEAVWREIRNLCLMRQSQLLAPISVRADPGSGIILVLRREATGLVRRMDELELWFTQDDTSVAAERVDPSVAVTVSEIAILLSSVRKHLENRQESFFQECLEGKSEPGQIAADIADKVMEEHGAISSELARFLNSAGPITQGFCYLKHLLAPGFEPPTCSPHKHLTPSFSHELAEKCSAQIIQFRYALCRDLLIIISLLNLKRKFVGLQSLDENAVSATMRVAFEQNTLAYWLAQLVCSTPVATVQSISKQTLVRKLPLVDAVAEMYVFEEVEKCGSLSDLYVRSYGFKTAAMDCRKTHSLDDTIDTLLTTIGCSVASQLVSHSPKFITALLSSCQYVEAQTYLHFLQGQSVSDRANYAYSGLACYMSGEPDKACEIFVQGLQNEFEQDQMEEDDLTQHSQRLGYVLNVMSLFEGDDLYSCLTELLSLALRFCDPNSSLASTLWCKLFSACLNLGQTDSAYQALESNPDVSQRRDLLRTFLFQLMERGQAQKLLHFSYNGMDDHIHDYLLSRARSLNVFEGKDMYSFLYSLNIMRNNPRRAAIITYEQAYRLKMECEPKISTLQQRVQCLLGTIACLELVDPVNAWVEEPGLNRVHDDDMKGEDERDSINVYGLPEIRKEYELAVAQLNLLNAMERQGMYSLAPSTAEETVAQLMKMRSYELAIATVKRFDIDAAPVIDSLSSDYVHLLKSLKSDLSAESETLQMIRSNNPTVREDHYGRPLEQVQRLLENSLKTAEKPLETLCHRASAYRMLTSDICLPAWLVKSYATRNQAELISLYHQLGFLEEACRLAVERYSEMARRLDFMAFKRTEEDLPPSRVIILDRLVLELRHQAKVDSFWNKALGEVQNVRSQYLESVRKADAALYG